MNSVTNSVTMHLSILVLFLFASGQTFATAQVVDHHCFLQHLQDAAKQNAQRAVLYAELTEGRSIWISSQLVLSEELAQGFARKIDLEAAPFQAAGVPIICNDFVPMSHTPAFLPRFSGTFPRGEDRVKYSAFQLVRNINQWNHEEDFQGLEQYLTEQMDLTASEPRLDCMQRHILASILRIAHFAPSYIKSARAKRLRSPVPLIKDVISNQALALFFAKPLDAAAISLHEEGIPIICQDVPAIGTEPLPQYQDQFSAAGAVF